MIAYRQLQERFGRMGALTEAIRVLHWDAAAMMPKGGAAARAEQMAALRLLAHQSLTAPEIGDLLAEAETEGEGLNAWQRANLHEMRQRWTRAAALPGDLVEAFSRICSECETLWRQARPANDFAAVRPALERMLALVREVAAARAAALGTTPYEALIDQYEPGFSDAAIAALFTEIAGFLPDLTEAVLARQAAQPSTPAPAGPFPIERQRQAAMRLMSRIGFDFERGRLDTSAHPFCGGTPDDVRITTRFDEDDFSKALMGALHETGHALYASGLPAEWRRQPVGAARGMAMHESQSLLLEMQVCRSPAFFVFAAPLLREIFGGAGAEWEAASLHRRQIRVRRSLIRVDADEVTYPAHVILRYRLEHAMITGDLAVAELPAAWAEGLQSLLGIAPDSDRDGCLQDVHWYDGAWGYFPTYTLGALIAAQLFEAMRHDLPDILEAVAAGDFAPLIGWLRGRVHDKGSLLSTADLIESATGRPLATVSFERHLRARYLDEPPP